MSGREAKTHYFSSRALERLRTQSERLRNRFGLHEGWFVDTWSARDLAESYSRLALRDEYSIAIFAFSSGGNGHGIVFGFPPGEAPPPYDEVVTSSGFVESTPPNALPHFMGAVALDGTPRSYMQASIFGRELEELAAQWHGLEWGTHVLLENSRADGDLPIPADGRSTELPGGPWEWAQVPKPDWQPRVTVDGDDAAVTFYTCSEMGEIRVVEHTDRYDKPVGPEPRVESRQLGTGGLGYIP